VRHGVGAFRHRVGGNANVELEGVSRHARPVFGHPFDEKVPRPGVAAPVVEVVAPHVQEGQARHVQEVKQGEAGLKEGRKEGRKARHERQEKEKKE